MVATTVCSCFVIPKQAFFHNVSKDIHESMLFHITNDKPPVLTDLWDTTPKLVGVDEWRVQKTWNKFKSEVHRKDCNILQNYRFDKQYFLNLLLWCYYALTYRRFKTISLTPESGNMKSQVDPYIATDTDYHRKAKADLAKMRAPKPTVKRSLKTLVKSISSLSHPAGFGKKANKTTTDSSLPLQAQDVVSGRGVIVSGKENTAAEYRFPFSLMHFHRENVQAGPDGDPRRLIRCHIRLCGTMASCAEAITSAQSIMLNAFLSVLGSDVNRAKEVSLYFLIFTFMCC